LVPLDALGKLTAGDRQDSADTVDGSAQRGGIGEPDYQMVTPPSARSAIQVTVRRQAAVDADRAQPRLPTTGVRSRARAAPIIQICTVANLPELDCTAAHNGGSVRVLTDLTYHSA